MISKYIGFTVIRATRFATSGPGRRRNGHTARRSILVLNNFTIAKDSFQTTTDHDVNCLVNTDA